MTGFVTKHLLTVLTTIAVLMIGGVTVFAQDSDDMNVEALTEEFWTFLQDSNYEYNWAYEPGVTQGFYEGQEPHGLRLKSLANPIAVNAAGSGLDTFPLGSFLVKENYTPELELDSYTIMVKMQEGYAPDSNDWFWAKYQPDGTVDASGQVAGCIGCHSQAEANDYVFNASLASSD